MKITADSPLGQKLLRQGRVKPEDFRPAVAAPKGNKNHAVPTADSTGRVHPSKLQARVTDRERALNPAVIPEVSVPLSTRSRDRMKIDLLIVEVIEPDGLHFRGRFADPKGQVSRDWEQRRRRFLDLYGLNIEIIKK